MDKQELIKAIARIRRNMPRNADVMEVCDYAESRLTELPLVITPLADGCVEIKQVMRPDTSVKFDKTVYMRNYMRKLRAAKKANA